MTQIVVFPLGQLSAKDKERFTKAGIVYAECQDPHKVVTVIPSTPMASSDDLLMSAIYAMVESGSGITANNFIRELNRRLKSKEKP